METTEGRHPTAKEAAGIINKSILTDTKEAQYAEWEKTLGKAFEQQVRAIVDGGRK